MPMNLEFNNRLRQVILLAIIILLVLLIFKTLRVFLPGMLGAVTLYILTRGLYFQLTMKRRWSKPWTALLFMICFLILVSIPIYITVELVSPKINQIINNQDHIVESLRNFSVQVQKLTGLQLLSEDNVTSITQQLTALIPKLLNSTANLLTNLIMLFFIYYYLLTNGLEMERLLMRLVPLKRSNIDQLAAETKTMVKANALGIPIICIIQGIFATIGYWLFGIEDWALWGFVTAVMAYFPLVGTMIVWVPLVIVQFASGDTANGIWLTIYSLIVTGNVDYVTRLGLMKKLGDVHPVITVIGVIVGLGMFGFIGLIFGPLILSYLFVLIKIYVNEFTEADKI